MSEEWADSDFKQRIVLGRACEAAVAQAFIAAGLEVYVPPLKIRPNFEERAEYRDKRDMLVNGQEIEVKSTSRPFLTPDDWPFDLFFVDTAEKIESKGVPLAFVVISQVTSKMFVIPGKTRPHWEVFTGNDKKRGIGVAWLACRKTHLRTFSELVEHLRKML